MSSDGLTYYVEFPAHTNVKDTENSTVVLYCTEKDYACAKLKKKQQHHSYIKYIKYRCSRPDVHNKFAKSCF